MSDRKVSINKDGKKVIRRTNNKGVKIKRVMSAKNEDGKRTLSSTTRKNAGGTKTTRRTNDAGSTYLSRKKKDGSSMSSLTKKDGSKQVSRTNPKGTIRTQATNKRGRVTEMTRTKKDGEKVTQGKKSVAVKAANIAKSGTSKLAKRMQSLKAKKKAARKAGDTGKLAELTKKRQSTRRNIKSNIRTRRAEKKAN